ncbi:MAG: electron transport complex subunit RsxG [Amphritea sp.]
MSKRSFITRLRAHLAYPSLLLGTAVLLATSLLALGHLATKTVIAQRQAEDLINSLAQVIPSSLHDNNLLTNHLDLPAKDGNQQVFLAMQGQTVTAVAYSRVTREGYGGPIRLLLGVAADGKLLGVRVLSHSETPGLGDKIEIAKSDWILEFNGLSLTNPPAGQWAVKKDGGHFDQFTGATITPRALVKEIRNGLMFFENHRSTLFQAAIPQPLSTTEPVKATFDNRDGGSQ